MSTRIENSVYFRDSLKKIDYVLIFSKIETTTDKNKMKIISSYINNIKSNGLHVEFEEGLVFEDMICVKIHAPMEVLKNYADLFKIDLTKDNPNYKYQLRVLFKWMGSIVTIPDENDPVFQRAPATISGTKPTDLTDAERVLVVYRLLLQIPYGSSPTEIGFESLVSRKILHAAYPIHDSLCKWTKEGPLTDRQLLARYWASLRCFYKQQPLNLIHKYYGPEIGFYFAWIGFYTQMLVPAAIIGLLCFLIGIIQYSYDKKMIENEICETNQLICPVCPGDEFCGFTPLNHACTLTKLAYILENPVTVFYSIVMTFWGVVFMILWKRKQAMLRLRWNLYEIPAERQTRPSFIKAARLERISSITGETEYYLSPLQKVGAKTASYLIFLAMFLAYSLGVLIVMYYRLNVLYYGRKSSNTYFKEVLSIFETFTSAFLSFLIMCFFDSFKYKLCRKLTGWENPRTEAEFETKYTVKVIVLSFGNVFGPIVYLAFFKGHFHTHPGDSSQWTTFGVFKADVCKLSGCLVDLSVQLIIIMIVKNGARLFTEIMFPIIKVHIDKFNASPSSRKLAYRWEDDFHLMKNRTLFLYLEYIEMALQYGLMTFFVVALPIAPLLALLNNIIEIRLDAIKILKHYRRIVPRQVSGIDQWNTVMKAITVLGTISNPLLIAFSSNLIPRFIYRIRNNNSLRGFINSTLSEFAVKDFPENVRKSRKKHVQYCMYPGRRYPSSHPEKYELTSDYWHQLAVKALFFIVLENVCLLFSLFLAYVVPEIPRKVQIKLEYEEKLLRESRIKSSKS